MIELKTNNLDLFDDNNTETSICANDQIQVDKVQQRVAVGQSAL